MFQWLKRLRSEDRSKPLKKNNDEERWEKLERILGFSVSSPDQYRLALRHRSILEEDKIEKHETYERLEFLGDAVLDLIVTEIIFESFPLNDEGFLTKLRSKLVKKDTLAQFALNLGLDSIAEVGDSSHGPGTDLSKSVLSDLFESLVAAIYLTEGYNRAYQFVHSIIREHKNLEELSKKIDNFKSVLLELTQAKKLPLPSYRVISESGPGHDKTFRVVVSVDGEDYGTGTGKSKKEAEQLAAKEAVEVLNKNDE